MAEKEPTASNDTNQARLKTLPNTYKPGLLEAYRVGRTHAYLPRFSIAFGAHPCCTTQLGLGVQRRGWHCYCLDYTLLPEPMAEAATRTEGSSSLG